MNEYGMLAKTHWQRWLKSRYAAIDPSGREEFFQALGEQVAQRVADLQESLETGLDWTSLGYLETVGRLNGIRAQAREIALKELVLLEPEPELVEMGYDESDRPFDPAASIPDPLAAWMDSDGMPLDRRHELWRMVQDDTVTSGEFLAASKAWEDSLWEKLNPAQPQ